MALVWTFALFSAHFSLAIVAFFPIYYTYNAYYYCCFFLVCSFFSCCFRSFHVVATLNYGQCAQALNFLLVIFLILIFTCETCTKYRIGRKIKYKMVTNRDNLCEYLLLLLRLLLRHHHQHRHFPPMSGVCNVINTIKSVSRTTTAMKKKSQTPTTSKSNERLKDCIQLLNLQAAFSKL